jgi:hypothetical protein
MKREERGEERGVRVLTSSRNAEMGVPTNSAGGRGADLSWRYGA